MDLYGRQRDRGITMLGNVLLPMYLADLPYPSAQVEMVVEKG